MRKIFLAAIAALAFSASAHGQVVNQPFTLTITVTPACSAIALSSATLTGGPNNANAVVGAVNITPNPPGGSYAGTVTLGGTNAGSFALTNGGRLPTNLTVGPANIAAGSYAITLSCS